MFHGESSICKNINVVKWNVFSIVLLTFSLDFQINQSGIFYRKKVFLFIYLKFVILLPVLIKLGYSVEDTEREKNRVIYYTKVNNNT